MYDTSSLINLGFELLLQVYDQLLFFSFIWFSNSSSLLLRQEELLVNNIN
jgi:hypothetical protein